MSLLIRVHHPSGRSRLTLAHTTTFQALQAEIHKISAVPPQSQSLSLDEAGKERVVGRPGASIEMVGLTNGCVVWVKGTVECKPEPVAPSATGTTAVEESKGPTHQTFESYLRIRRFDIGTLPGNLKYHAVPRKALTKLPPSVTLTRQPYRHVDHVEFMNVAEIGNFVRHWQTALHCVTQRCGWLYGYYVEDTKAYDEGYRAVVEGIYEPPQSQGEEDTQPIVDGELAQVDKLMEILGLERLGYIWTTRPRLSLITSKEIVRQAKRQLDLSTEEHYTGYRLSKQVGIVVKVDEAGHAEPEAVMASDQAMAMVRDCLIKEEDQIAGEQNVKIRTSDEKHELLPTVLQEYKEVKEFDADWLVVKVNHSAPVKPRSFFKFNHFPRENRGELVEANYRGYFGKIPKNVPTWEVFSDFHLLLFIARIIDFDTAAAIALAVKDKAEVAEGFVELVKAAVNQF